MIFFSRIGCFVPQLKLKSKYLIILTLRARKKFLADCPRFSLSRNKLEEILPGSLTARYDY